MNLKQHVLVKYNGGRYIGYICGITKGSRNDNKPRYDVRVTEGEHTSGMIHNLYASCLTPIDEPKEETTTYAGNGWAGIARHPKALELVKG